ncbi:MAG: hypothetical protein FWH18_11975 [Marinilabiliaceae bacterium]|nr:hypothetical protein [Marinilabiliaceae bacterium]
MLNKIAKIENFVATLESEQLSDQQQFTLAVNPDDVMGGATYNGKDCTNPRKCNGSTNGGDCVNQKKCTDSHNVGSCGPVKLDQPVAATAD